MSNIKGGEYPLSKIFSSEFVYNIPSYQRPYSWTTDEAGILFDDLYDFYISENSEENYFLGSIVLIKKRRYSVIRCNRWSAEIDNSDHPFSYNCTQPD